MIASYLQGLRDFFGAFSIIKKYNLWPYVAVSGVISIVIAITIFSTAYNLADNISSWLMHWYPFDTASGFMSGLFEVLGGLSITVFGLLLFKYVLLIVVSPIMSMMSENLERKITNVPERSSSIASFIKDLSRGIVMSVRNMSREIGITLVLFIISFFPGAAIITTPLIFLTQAYFAGFGNMDFYMERHCSIQEAAEVVRKDRSYVLGNGSAFLALYLIPIIGWILAPGLGTVSSTMRRIEQDGGLDYFA